MKRWLVGGMLVALAACKGQSLTPSEQAPSQPAAAQPSGLPTGHPPVTVNGADNGAAPAGPGGNVEGRIEVAPAVADKIKAGDTIFVIARNGVTNAPLAAVKLQAPPKFPLAFKLTPQNIMMPGASLSGNIKLLVRVDKDGDAITKKPGDVVGEVAGGVQVPAQNVVVTLNQVL